MRNTHTTQAAMTVYHATGHRMRDLTCPLPRRSC